MRVFSALAIVLSLLAPLVHAQSAAAFYPLADGDTWTYQRINRPRYSNPDPTMVGYRRVSVVSDTTVGAALFKTVRVEWLGVTQQVDSTARCIVRFSQGAARAEWTSVRGTCGASEDLAVLQASPSVRPYRIGDNAYTGAVRTTTVTTSAPPTSSQVTPADGIGVLESVKADSPYGYLRQQQLLTSALVGGVQYGGVPALQTWREFAPLGVGDRWVYKLDPYRTSQPNAYLTQSVVGVEVVGGVTYATTLEADCTAAFVCGGSRSVLRRHRDDLHCVVRRSGTGSESCESPTLRLASVRTLATTRSVAIGGSTVDLRTIEDGFNNGEAYRRYTIAEGVGEVYVSSWRSGSSGGDGVTKTLLYARAGGVEYGTAPQWAIFGTPDDPGAPVAPAFAVRLGSSNPTRGTVTLRVTSPQRASVHVEAFDVLGRRVAQSTAEIAAGETALALDLIGRAPGVYLVRIAGRAGIASVPVTLY